MPVRQPVSPGASVATSAVTLSPEVAVLEQPPRACEGAAPAGTTNSAATAAPIPHASQPRLPPDTRIVSVHGSTRLRFFAPSRALERGHPNECTRPGHPE